MFCITVTELCSQGSTLVQVIAWLIGAFIWTKSWQRSVVPYGVTWQQYIAQEYINQTHLILVSITDLQTAAEQIALFSLKVFK